VQVVDQDVQLPLVEHEEVQLVQQDDRPVQVVDQDVRPVQVVDQDVQLHLVEHEEVQLVQQDVRPEQVVDQDMQLPLLDHEDLPDQVHGVSAVSATQLPPDPPHQGLKICVKEIYQTFQRKCNCNLVFNICHITITFFVTCLMIEYFNLLSFNFRKLKI
jgi:hypothetical protein